MDTSLHKFQAQLRQLLREPVGFPLSAKEAVREICEGLKVENPIAAREKQENPLSGLMAQLVESVDELPVRLHPLAHSFFAIADYLTWYQRSAPDRPEFMAGHLNAQIIGPRGLDIREDITVGVALMQPGITYPDHHHPPEEVYIVLSQGRWRQKDNPWHSPGLGGYVYNPSNILHAMQSLDKPLFAIWCLTR
ncbi:transcriptional regulator [Amphritea opalescens]|uniref:Transcriptional regulator n=1 Tax=Amphritea opalescens TaxID=2490544 RepID=A0A430KU85_9GAMM|nr:dimethylsulfonioproprionate lyase family protein [Amphritea opalescens]RTE67050.1 transcriptional regulator [Amphritea opalescens]